jgi:hypothetical protein
MILTRSPTNRFEDKKFAQFVDISILSLEAHNAFFPDTDFTGNLYQCHVWKKIKEMKYVNETAFKSRLNELILLREEREFSTEDDPFFFRIIPKGGNRYNFLLIDNEEGVEHLVISVVPRKSEIWSVKTKNFRLLTIIKTITQIFKMVYNESPEDAGSGGGGVEKPIRRYDEVSVEGETDGEEDGEEEEYEIDMEAQVLSGRYGWPSGKYVTV